jgi:hypothetical protein
MNHTTPPPVARDPRMYPETIKVDAYIRRPMSESLQKRRRITRELGRLWSEKKEAALQVRRACLLSELLPYLTAVAALSHPGIVELVAEYAIRPRPTRTVLITGLGMEVIPMGERHIATLVHELLDKITSREAQCGLPVFRFTCNGHDIAVDLQLNPHLTLGDVSNGASVTKFVRHIRQGLSRG